MRTADYATLDEFKRRYYDKIAKICAVSIDNNIEDTTDRSFALWCDVRSWANRKPTNLCFDCVYIIGNATGNKNTTPFLTYISEQLAIQLCGYGVIYIQYIECNKVNSTYAI